MWDTGDNVLCDARGFCWVIAHSRGYSHNIVTGLFC